MKTIILDCDGVLLDWELSFSYWLLANKRITVVGRPTSWDLSKWIGRSEEECFSFIREFNSSYLFADVLPTSGTMRVVRDWWQRKFDLIVLSCYKTNSKSELNRIYNLQEMYGNVFEEIISLPLRASKQPHLKALYEAHGQCIFVDDNPLYAVQGASEGHIAYCLRCPHNRSVEKDFPNLIWIDNLSEVKC